MPANCRKRIRLVFNMDEIQIPIGREMLGSSLNVPRGATVLVVFVHGSGSSRHSLRNQCVARSLNEAGLATLLFDLLTPEEEAIDVQTAEYRFDISLPGRTARARHEMGHGAGGDTGAAPRYFGASTGGGAALVAPAELPREIGAVVSRGGRPDLAAGALSKVQAPTLLIVGADDVVIDLNE